MKTPNKKILSVLRPALPSPKALESPTVDSLETIVKV